MNRPPSRSSRLSVGLTEPKVTGSNPVGRAKEMPGKDREAITKARHWTSERHFVNDPDGVGPGELCERGRRQITPRQGNRPRELRADAGMQGLDGQPPRRRGMDATGCLPRVSVLCPRAVIRSRRSCSSHG